MAAKWLSVITVMFFSLLSFNSTIGQKISIDRMQSFLGTDYKTVEDSLQMEGYEISDKYDDSTVNFYSTVWKNKADSNLLFVDLDGTRESYTVDNLSYTFHNKNEYSKILELLPKYGFIKNGATYEDIHDIVEEYIKNEAHFIMSIHKSPAAESTTYNVKICLCSLHLPKKIIK
jgi:hypothetical protein